MLLLEIIKKARYLFIIAAGAFAVTAIASEYKQLYAFCILFVLLFIAADATVMIMQRKKGIPIKYHENYFKFKKRK